MKNLLLIPLLMGTLLQAQVNSFPWTETFETSSTTAPNWTQIYESGTKQWSIVSSSYYGYTTGPHNGSLMAEFDITSFSGDTTKYVSPTLDLSAVTNPTLEFFYRNKDWGGDQNEINVYYRTNPTASWTLIQNYNTSISDWTSSGTLNLPTPTSTYQIAIEGVANYGSSINVDDVTVQASQLSTSENTIQKTKITLAPNPASDYIKVISTKPLSKITILDFNGKIIVEKYNANKEYQIDIKSLNPGVYLINYTDKEGNVEHSKFIKK